MRYVPRSLFHECKLQIYYRLILSKNLDKKPYFFVQIFGYNFTY